MDWLQNNWQFLVGDIFIPIVTFVIGLFVGKIIERKKAISRIKGNDNTVIQNSKIETSNNKNN